MEWFRIRVTAEEATTDFHGKIQDQFEQVLMQSQDRKSVALLASSFSGRGEFYIYFTPGCVSNQGIKAIMDIHGAEPCDEPTRDTEESLSLIVGDQIQWSEYMWSPDLP